MSGAAMGFAHSSDLQNDLRSPDAQKREEATRQIFARYFQRLWNLVQANLHPRIRQRVDPEDIINSGVKSLVLDFREGVVSPDCKEKLWVLLAQAVLSKARQAARRHTAQKRNVFREKAAADAQEVDPVWDYLAAAEPSAHEAVCLQEAIEGLPEDLQPVAVGKLQGKTDQELAQELGYASTETIRVKTRLIQSLLQEFFDQQQ
jgi:hypothetical protein